MFVQYGAIVISMYAMCNDTIRGVSITFLSVLFEMQRIRDVQTCSSTGSLPQTSTTAGASQADNRKQKLSLNLPCGW